MIDEKPHENILTYDVSYKTLIDPKPLRIRFDKIDGFIKIYDGARYISFLTNTQKINVDSYGSSPIEKELTLHNVVILIKSVFNKDKNHCYYNIFCMFLSIS